MCLSDLQPDARHHRRCSPDISVYPARQYNFVIAVRRVCRKRGAASVESRVFLAVRASENTRLHDRRPSRSQITLHPHANARWNWQPAISVTRPSSSLFSLSSYQAYILLMLLLRLPFSHQARIRHLASYPPSTAKAEAEAANTSSPVRK